METQM